MIAISRRISSQGRTMSVRLSMTMLNLPYTSICRSAFTRLHFKTRPVFLTSCRKYADSSKDTIIKEKTSKHTTYRKVIKHDSTAKAGKEAPLVVFFPWIDASSSQMDKYCDLYHTLGWDVLTVQSGSWMDFIWPANAVKVAREVHDVLDACSNSVPLVVHSMSVGAYIYAVTVDELRHRPGGEQITDRILGQVYDSLVIGGYSGIPKMVQSGSKMITSDTFLQRIIQDLGNGYFAITKKHTADRLTHYVNEVVHNPIQAPILLFASEADPWCDIPELLTYIHNWQLNELNVTLNLVKDSGHVLNLKTYPLQYRVKLYTFLRQTLAGHDIEINFES